MDGGNGKSTTLDTGIENENDLKHIYIRGALDTSPIVKEEPETEPVEADILDPTLSELSPGTEGFVIESETEALETEPPPATPRNPVDPVDSNEHRSVHTLHSGCRCVGIHNDTPDTHG